LVGGDIGKLPHILLPRIKSAGKTIFFYKVCDKIEMDVTCLTKISTDGDSQPDSMLFSKQWLKLKMISWQLKLKMPWQACKINYGISTRTEKQEKKNSAAAK